MKKETIEGQEPNNQSPVSDDRLEAVRDLLFGQNVQEYRDEFKELKDLLQQQRDELEQQSTSAETQMLDRLGQLEKKLSDQLTEATKEINTRLDALSNDKADRKQLAKLLQSIASELES
ncbi:hypothetical protein [Ekhidna sp.]